LSARGLVAATTTDATNLYIILYRTGTESQAQIIARASEEDAEKHLLTAGADFIVLRIPLRATHRANLPAPACGQLS